MEAAVCSLKRLVQVLECGNCTGGNRVVRDGLSATKLQQLGKSCQQARLHKSCHCWLHELRPTNRLAHAWSYHQ